MSSALTILAAGPQSTIQDRGRLGYLRFGVSATGAFDTWLHAVANLLVGNPPDTAAVEFTLKGDTYEVAAATCRVAIAGDFKVEIDGKAAAAWRSHALRGQRLTVGGAARGARGYLAVAGGLDLPDVLGSRSVHTRSGIGPCDGRALRAGDSLPLAATYDPAGPDLRFDVSALPPPRTDVRVVMGPQQHYFSTQELAAFTESTFDVTPKCDRMGYQLKGPALEYRKDIPLISDGVALGSIQVVSAGLVVVTLVDRQTTGGYPKIATVITPDIRVFAHTVPGAKVRFVAVDIEEAQRIRRQDDALRGRLKDHIGEVAGLVPTTERLLATNLISGVVGLDDE